MSTHENVAQHDETESVITSRNISGQIPQRNIASESASILDSENPLEKCRELVCTPGALAKEYARVLKNQTLCDPIVATLDYYLQMRLVLDLPIPAPLIDKKYAQQMQNSLIINSSYELVPLSFQEQFESKKLYSRFGEIIAWNDISKDESVKALDYLNSLTMEGGKNLFNDKAAVTLALELVLGNSPQTTDLLKENKLPQYEKEPNNKYTEQLIFSLKDHFREIGYTAINFTQLLVVANCMAFEKRFSRKRWRLDVQDVLKAWCIITYFMQRPPPLSPPHRKIIEATERFNKEGTFPSQNAIIQKTKVANNTVNKALGLQITSRKAGKGSLIDQRYIEYDYVKEGYYLKELGRIALYNDFYVIANDKIYTPKHPLE